MPGILNYGNPTPSLLWLPSRFNSCFLSIIQSRIHVTILVLYVSSHMVNFFFFFLLNLKHTTGIMQI